PGRPHPARRAALAGSSPVSRATRCRTEQAPHSLEADPAVDTRIGARRVLLRLHHDPALVADIDQGLRDTAEIEVAIARRREHAGQHTVEEAPVPRAEVVEYPAARVFGVHVRDAIRMAADQPLGIDAA